MVAGGATVGVGVEDPPWKQGQPVAGGTGWRGSAWKSDGGGRFGRGWTVACDGCRVVAGVVRWGVGEPVRGSGCRVRV